MKAGITGKPDVFIFRRADWLNSLMWRVAAKLAAIMRQAIAPNPLMSGRDFCRDVTEEIGFFTNVPRVRHHRHEGFLP
jgi:hypothetical protein